jgi:WD40 repeat protein
VYSPDGKRLASAGNGVVKVWDAKTGQEVLSLESDSFGVAFSPDGKRLASVGKVWDPQTGQELFSFKGDTHGYLTGVAYSPDGKRLASSSGSEVKVRDAQTGQELLTLIGGSDIQRLAFPNDHWLVSAAGRTVRIWDGTPLPEKP